MTITIVTGWSPAGWDLYGRNFAESFAEFWPEDIRLIVYVEETTPLPRGEQVNIRGVPEIKEFLDRYRYDQVAQGRCKHHRHRWKPKEIQRGYCYRYDAYKFGRVALYLRHALGLVPTESILIWLDGDVVTFKRPPKNWLDRLLPAGANVSYLGRPGAHPDIAWQGYRLPAARPLIERFADYYTTGEFSKLPEWHSAFVWMRALLDVGGCRAHNLTPNGSGHVWTQSPLFEFMDHLKGDERKRNGRSVQRDEQPAA